MQRVVVDDPWADPEIPSLVHEDADGRIVGFIAASTRRMRLDGRPVRMAVSSNLVAHPDWRSRGVGVLLNRKLLAGPQELTVADRANDDSRALWMGLGGQELVGSSVSWWRILRPGATAGALADGAVPASPAAHAWPACTLDALAARLARFGPPPPPDPDGTTEVLTPEVLAEQIEQAAAAAAAAGLRRGVGHVGLRRARPADRSRQARRPAGARPAAGASWAGSSTCCPRTGSPRWCRSVATGDPAPVLDHLVRTAHDAGAAAVQGRLEPVTAGWWARPASSSGAARGLSCTRATPPCSGC